MVLPLFADPPDGSIQGYPVDPGSNGRFLPESRYGAPDLERDLLEQVILVHRCTGISPHNFKDEHFMLVEPLRKNLLLFLYGHKLVVYIISTGRRRFLTVSAINL